MGASLNRLCVAVGVQVVEKMSFVFTRQQELGFLQSAFVWVYVKLSMRHSSASAVRDSHLLY